MKKILCLMLACLTFLCVLVGCNSKESGESCNHEGATLGWIVSDTTHKQIYTCCGTIKQEGSHVIESGTCKICGIGNLEGSSDSDSSDEGLSDKEIENLFKTFEPTHYATIDVENYGKIKLALYGKVAPITVENFVKLANEGFYNGLTFHRIMEGFMMQGGCPDGTGGGSYKDENGKEVNIKGEFEANGYKNNIPHVRGVISMARADPYDSASSQFFIVHEESTFLDGYYAAFGYVVEGIEVVDAVCKAAKPTDDNGTIPSADQPKIISVKIEVVK